MEKKVAIICIVFTVTYKSCQILKKILFASTNNLAARTLFVHFFELTMTSRMKKEVYKSVQVLNLRDLSVIYLHRSDHCQSDPCPIPIYIL